MTNPKIGDKVKVIDSLFKHMPSYRGKEGAVVGAVTDSSCRVKLMGGAGEFWFDFRELEITKEAK